MQESSGFRLRVDGQLRQEFIEACRAEDRAAAQVLREFMREYVARHRHNKQANLFSQDLENDTKGNP